MTEAERLELEKLEQFRHDLEIKRMDHEHKLWLEQMRMQAEYDKISK